LTWEGIFVLAVVGCIVVSLLREWLSVDATLMTGLIVVVAAGIVELEAAIQGFANTTLLALGSLYIVATAMRKTGVLTVGADYLLGTFRSIRRTLLRICVPVTTFSAFFNNTPIVAMGIPAIQSWSRKHDVSDAKLLIPLSFASIFGGICTLIGTSTNLVTDGLLRADGYEGFGFFEFGYVGLPVALVGWAYLVLLAPLLLDDRESPVEPETSGDAAEDGAETDTAAGRETHRIVVPETSSLIGERVDEAPFRERYNADVLHVLRDGEEVGAPLDELHIAPSDTLVLDTGSGFREAFEDESDFYVLSQQGGTEESASPREQAEFDRTGAWLAIGTLATIVGLAASGTVHISMAAMLGAALLMGAGLINPGEAREAIDWQVLIVIGSAIGLGEAMETSGAAEWVGRGIIEMGVSFGDVGLVVAVVVGSSILSQVITNYGAVALFFPIATSIAEARGLPLRPLVIGMSISAALSFTIPIYQTNLMVYSAGNYRMTDFVRIGLPLQVLLWSVVVGTIAYGWGLGV
jgi:di/tricarboxylate transporter